MRESLFDLGPELLSLLIYGVSGTVLGIVGAALEYRSYLLVSSGEGTIALWMGALGAVLLALSLLVVRDKAGGAYSDLRSQ
jgi:hypothetical protein